MNQYSWVAVCAFIATLILHSYQPTAMLTWRHRQSRKRALFMMLLITAAAITGEKTGNSFAWRVANLPVALLLCAVFIRHLRQSGSYWCGPRLIPLTRLIVTVGAFFWAVISLRRPELWAILSMVCGFWNAALLKKENFEITEEFGQLKTRLATLYADRQSSILTDAKSTSELRDNSVKAS